MAETVLITGASSGLGLEFARIFAAEGYDLVLAARSVDKMEQIAGELRKSRDAAGSSSSGTRQQRIEVIFADLSGHDGASRLYLEIKRRGIRIDQLVNNAGAGKAGRTVDLDPDVMTGLVSLNVSSVALLCRLFGHDMVSRGSGRILNIASTTAFFPDPYFNVYGPSKAFVLSLTEAMSGELKGTGVTVTALCPGPVRTNWAVNAGKDYPALAADPTRVALAGYKAMQKGRLCCIPTPFSAAGAMLGPLLPKPLQVSIGAWWQKKMIRRKTG